MCKDKQNFLNKQEKIKKILAILTNGEEIQQSMNN